MTLPTWPAHETAQDYTFGAAVCKRGHFAALIDPRDLSRPPFAPERCGSCGARVLASCPSCGQRIHGGYPGVVGFGDQSPNFCDGCGSAYSWAPREARILELENLLDEGGVDDADLSVIRAQLDRLRQDLAISEKDEKALWSSVKARAGTVFMNEKVQALLYGIASAEARRHLGLPPT